ncbi:MAG: NADH-quinone oxidoreductase subunit J [Acidobacteriota bacterium]|jgi:NADH-quinone oxidoreductase subunit J|nr:NADH-quinone oxidoreductase subunit J [Bryobacteraceae bacterium CoA2 C42]MCE2654786.1 NADH-quinone oxidoreductase subunit J [Planctomycetaceae bacterium]
MTLDTLFFYAFTTLTLGGAALAVTRPSAVHAAIALMVSLLGVAGLYLQLTAEFLFVAQIILYIGGILLLFLFVIMLVNLDAGRGLRQFHRRWTVGAAVTAVAGVVLAVLGSRVQLPPAQRMPETGNVELVADTLLQDYLVPFEVVSLLLLVAVVGSVLLGRKRA